MNPAEEIRKAQVQLASIERRLTNIRAGGGGGNHNILSVTHSDALTQAVVAGDLISGNATPKWTRIGIGAGGTYLRSTGALPAWSAILVGDLPVPAIDHDALLNFVANKHIDHTAIVLTAGEGLIGGGDISANRSFALDINGLGEDAGAKSGDFFVYYDTDDGIHYKIDYDDLPGGGGASPWTVDVNDIYWNGTGHVTIGDIAPDTFMNNVGLCITTPLTADQLHFAIQNADVAHAFTLYANPDTYFAIQKNDDNYGGVWIAGFSDASAKTAMRLWGLSHTAPTGFTTASMACIDFCVAKASGGGGAKILDTSNAFSWINWTTTIMLLKGRGDLCFPDTQCRILLGDSVNTFQYSGITINQKGYDDEALSLKSSDVNHGMTTQTEYDTYGFGKKIAGPSGGFSIVGLTELNKGLGLSGISTSDDTTHGDGASAPVYIVASKKSGTTFGAVGAEGNLVVIANFTTEVWGVDAEGDVWQQGSLWILTIKSGATQVGAGASADELWKTSGHITLPDNVVMIGV